jgi:hypothetical protein
MLASIPASTLNHITPRRWKAYRIGSVRSCSSVLKIMETTRHKSVDVLAARARGGSVQGPRRGGVSLTVMSMHRIDTRDAPSWLTVALGFRINETTMLPLLSIAICVSVLLLPRHAFSRPRQERGA